MTRMPRDTTIRTYRTRRDFSRTAEPSPEAGAPRESGEALRFVVQKHAARRLHWDFRLQHDDVLWSWAVPKGPSLDPHDKRLAVHVEDHPLDYANFQGIIPEGQYGAGTVEIWDHGTWAPDGDALAGIAKGELKFTLDGRRLHGRFVLVRLRPRPHERGENWLLIKQHDADERAGADVAALEAEALPTAPPSAPPSVPEPARSRRRPDASHELHPVTLTHPERELWPGITKRDLATYWHEVAPIALPGIAGRPLAVVRCPAGIDGERFFQKHAARGMPGQIRAAEASGAPYLAIDDESGLIAFAQIAAIELHAWGATEADPDHPDRIVFDLDPGEDVPFAEVAAAAMEVRERLETLGLACFCRTSGGKGLHVVVPLRPRASWDAVKPWCHEFAQGLERDAPDRYVSKMSKVLRRHHILVDWLRNGLGATAIASYSPRARPGATVAAPLAWREVNKRLDPAGYTLRTLKRRLARLRRDPWEGFIQAARPLPKAGT
jgi:bifunctional non-homologous end joining protein LigD